MRRGGLNTCGCRWLTFAAHFGAQWLDLKTDAAARLRRLWLVLVVIFAPLVIVKYTHFVLADVLQAGVAAADYRWALPLGISFITFTVTAYVVDVYRRRYAREKSLALMLGYVLFFPHLIAGPILRPMNSCRSSSKSAARWMRGSCSASACSPWVSSRKLVFADRISAAVEPVYANAAGLTAWHYLVAIYGFSVQIYCDFSGYTDMAIGLAYLLRIRLHQLPASLRGGLAHTILAAVAHHAVPSGFVIISTYRWAGTGGARPGKSSTCSSPWCSAGSGMAPTGPS